MLTPIQQSNANVLARLLVQDAQRRFMWEFSQFTQLLWSLHPLVFWVRLNTRS